MIRRGNGCDPIVLVAVLVPVIEPERIEDLPSRQRFGVAGGEGNEAD